MIIWSDSLARPHEGKHVFATCPASVALTECVSGHPGLLWGIEEKV